MEIYLQCSLNSAENRDPGLSKSSAGVPNSLTCPCSITRILSEDNTVSTLQEVRITVPHYIASHRPIVMIELGNKFNAVVG